jgi:hypothetical protein
VAPQVKGINDTQIYSDSKDVTNVLEKVKAKHFAIIPGGVETTNRRFAMMGVPLIAWLFVKTILRGHWNSYFLKDQHYWVPF